MQRYFVRTDQFQDQFVTIEGNDSHHLQRVMRAQLGDQVICSDGLNLHVKVRIMKMDKDAVTGEMIEHVPPSTESNVRVWIAQSLPKADKMELIIQKGTELGAMRFTPFVSARTIVHYDAKKETIRAERWQKIAKEAAEQAHRYHVPQVDRIHTWVELLELAQTADVAWIFFEKEEQMSLRSAIRQALAIPTLRNIMMIIGPEGGFSEHEIAQAQQAHIASVSLGKRILRTETASWVGLTCVGYETGEMGG